MASRDRMRGMIRCPGCGEEAMVHASEADHPYMRPHQHYSLDSVPEGYQIICSAPFEEARFMCKCGTLIYINPPPPGKTNIKEDGTVQVWDGEKWTEGEDAGIGL